MYGNIWGYDISLFNAKKNKEIILESEQNCLVINVVPSNKKNKNINTRLKIEKCKSISENIGKELFEVKSNFEFKISSKDKL